MRSLFSLILVCFFSSVTFSQSAKPVTWSFDIEKVGAYHIISATAKADDPWVVYSHYTDEGGPIGTSLELVDSSSEISKVEELIEEGKMIKEFSSLFDIDVTKFKNEVTFKQKIKIASDTKEVSGFIRFMTCDGLRCLPPTNVNFSLAVK